MAAELIPMPWLGQPAQPGAALARGVQTGATLRATWTRQRLAGLQQEALVLGNQMAELQLQEAERAIRIRQKNNEAFGELSSFIERSIDDGSVSNPNFMVRVTGLLARNSTLGEEPRTKFLMEMAGKAVVASQAHAQALALAQDREAALMRAQEAGLEQTKQTVDTPTGTATFETPESAKLQTTEKERLLDRLKAAQAIGDTQEVQNIMALAGKSGMRLETRPDGSVVFSQGPGGGAEGVTRSTLSSAEQSQLAAQDFVDFGNAIIELAKPENVGIQGKTRQILAESIGDYIPIETGDREEFAVSTQFFKARATKILKSDGAIADREVRDIIADLPSPGFLEASKTAKKKAISAMRLVVDSARRQMRQSGLALPPSVWKPDEIQALFNAGHITADQAQELMQKTPFRELEF